MLRWITELLTFTVWIDADACPRAIKDVLFRAAEKREVPLILIANQFLRVPPSKFISAVQVGAGFDVADNEIVERMAAGDLVITADIPLADDVVQKGGCALSPRGTLYTKENIKDHLTRRDMLDELRGTGVMTGGPPALDKKDVQTFSNALDRYRTQALRKGACFRRAPLRRQAADIQSPVTHEGASPPPWNSPLFDTVSQCMWKRKTAPRRIRHSPKSGMPRLTRWQPGFSTNP